MSKRQIRGRVVSDAGEKTIVVELTTRETHPIYKKRFTRSRKFHAHDEKNVAGIGDVVLIEECAPFSRTKTWILKEILEKGREKLELKKTEIEAEVDEAERKAAAHEKDEEDSEENSNSVISSAAEKSQNPNSDSSAAKSDKSDFSAQNDKIIAKKSDEISDAKEAEK